MDKLEEFHLGKLNLSSKDKKSFKKLAELDIFQDFIKKAVITIPYNTSASSIIEYLKDSFDKQHVVSRLLIMDLTFIFRFLLYFIFYFSFLFFSIFRATRVRVDQSRCHISHNLMA